MGLQSFSQALWSGIEEVYAAILEHPFIAGLSDGTLERDAFRFYVVQDAHYVREYARALSVAAARAPTEPDIAMFASHAVGAIEVERSLHESFFADFGLTDEEVAATPMAPTNLAYTSYLLAVAYGSSFAEVLGALLPCYWIYWELGRQLLGRGSPDPLYRRWIETYGGEEFAAIVCAVLEFADRLGPHLSDQERGRVADRFATTSRYEWMFWDMGYRQERWPTPANAVTDSSSPTYRAPAGGDRRDA
jgi:thiaminase/transcriptional activator TenA